MAIAMQTALVARGIQPLATLRRPTALQPAARQPVPLRARFVVRAAEQEQETIAEGGEERPRRKSSWELVEEPVRGKFSSIFVLSRHALIGCGVSAGLA